MPATFGGAGPTIGDTPVHLPVDLPGSPGCEDRGRRSEAAGHHGSSAPGPAATTAEAGGG